MPSPTQPTQQDTLRQTAILVAVIGAFVVNVWSNLAPIGGLNIGEISNTLFSDLLITPASYAFIIWGLIYVGLFVFAAYQYRPAQRPNARLRRGGYGLVVACLAQIIWVFLFLTRQFVGSLIAMLVILGALIVLYLGLGVGKADVSQAEQWRLQKPISLYMGWISVATVVNVAIALESLGWNGWGISDPIWTAIMVVVATLIAALVLIRRSDIVYALVFVWALVAIAIRQASLPIVLIPAAIAALVLVGLIIRTWRTK